MVISSIRIDTSSICTPKKSRIYLCKVFLLSWVWICYFLSVAFAGEPIFEIIFTLPYHSHIASEPVIQIAEAAAKLRALDKARDIFSSSLAVKLELRTREQQLALASAMFPILIHDRTVIEGPQLIVKARCYPHAEYTHEENIRNIIRQTEHLQLRTLAIKRFEQYVNEGIDLLTQAHTCTSSELRCNQSTSVLSKVKTISNRIKALQLFFVELDNFEYVWTVPEKTVLVLSEATSLDPDNTLVWLGLGECLVLLNRPYEGIKALQKVTTEHDAQARVLYMRGMANLQMYLPILAIRDISKALELEPEHPRWWQALGAAKLVAGETIAMCGDFYQACSMGSCEGLAEVRERNFCLEHSGS